MIEPLLMEALRLVAAGFALHNCCLVWVVEDDDEIIAATGVRSLGRTWHRQRWRMKAATVGLVAVPFLIHPQVLHWATPLVLAAFFHLVLWYWWTVFDVELNERRALAKFAIGKSAGSDQFLRRVQQRYGWSDQYTMNRVKLPGLALSGALLLGALYLRAVSI